MPPHGGSNNARIDSKCEKKKARRGRLQKQKVQEASFNIMFHNVNSFTDVVKKYYMSEAVYEGGLGITGPVAVAMLQETRRETVPSFGKWTVHTCPPGVNTGEGETAGVCAMVRVHLSHIPIEPQLPSALNLEHGANITGIIVRLRGLDVLILTVYMACTIHLSGANAHRMNLLERIIAHFGIPFIVGGDFNMEPAQFEEAQLGATFLSTTSSQILAPDAPTCVQSVMGRTIDFGIMSISLMPLLLAIDVVNTPTAPHLGVLIRLKKTARQVRTRKLVVPKELPTPPEPDIEKENEGKKKKRQRGSGHNATMVHR